jgi:GDP-L-fucose synthase
MFVDDLADALVFLIQHYSDESHVNIGTGQDITVAELAGLIKDVVGFDGALRYDPGQPDGAPRKLLDVNMLHKLGWTSKVGLRDGLERTYRAYLHDNNT